MDDNIFQYIGQDIFKHVSININKKHKVKEKRNRGWIMNVIIKGQDNKQNNPQQR